MEAKAVKKTRLQAQRKRVKQLTKRSVRVVKRKFTGTVKKTSLKAERKGVEQVTKRSSRVVKRKYTGSVKEASLQAERKGVKQITKRRRRVLMKKPFWHPLYDYTAPKRLEKLKWLKQHLTFDAYVVVNFIKKLDLKPEETFAGKIKYLQKKMIIFPSLGEKKTDVLKELLELVKKERTQTVEMLKKLYIQKAECENLILYESMKSKARDPSLPELSSRLPVWVGCQNETSPQMCGAVPPLETYKISPNHLVAAFVILGNDLPDEELGIAGSWILARCIRYRHDKYLVTDIDNVPKPLFKVRSNGLIPLPLYRADPERNTEAIFPVGAIVLALYIKTTCFFPAFVVDTPKTLGDTYTLRFRDLKNKLQWGPLIKVKQRYVIQYREAYNVFSKRDKRQLIKMRGYDSICKI